MPTSGQTRKRTAAIFVGLLLSLIYTSAAMQAPIELDSSEDVIESHELQRQLDALQIKHDALQIKHDTMQIKHDTMQIKHGALQIKHGALQHKYDALLHELPRRMKRKIRWKAETTEDWPQPSPNRLGEDDTVAYDSGCHITMAGRPSRASALANHPEQCTDDGDTANVRCCDDDGGGFSKLGCSNNHCCNSDKTFAEAVDECAAHDYRLCTKEELDQTAGTGCGFDNARVWTSSTPTPAPTSAPTSVPTLTLGSDHKFDWSDHSTADKEYWTQCESEGGDVNCAQCDTSGGSLACSALPPWSDDNHRPEDCPDSLGALKFWYPGGLYGRGKCKSFEDKLNAIPKVDTYSGSKEGIQSDGSVKLLPNANDFLPGVDGTFLGPHVITKATTAHAHKAARNIGAILFKRAVMHPHTNKTYADASGEERPLMVGDVAKVGYCIQCPSNVFSDKHAQGNNETDHQKFYDDCLVDAFEEVTTVDGTAVWQLNADYTCDVDSRDYRYFQALLSGY